MVVKILSSVVTHYTRVRVAALCIKCRDHRDATRLWNWIDCQSQPEPLWEVMTATIPWAFRDPTDSNSVKFTY